MSADTKNIRALFVCAPVTTSSNWRTDARLVGERRKIKCGEQHFKDALDVDYRVVSSAGDLP